MDICNPPRPLDDIVVFLRSAIERHLAGRGGRVRILLFNRFAVERPVAEGGGPLLESALFFVHTVFIHNGFFQSINDFPPRFSDPYFASFPRTIRYTLCTAPIGHRACVTLRLVGGYCTVRGYWLAPGSLDDDGDGFLARLSLLEHNRPLSRVLLRLLGEFRGGVDYVFNYPEEELGVLRRFWREVEVNVCDPLRRQW